LKRFSAVSKESFSPILTSDSGITPLEACFQGVQGN